MASTRSTKKYCPRTFWYLNFEPPYLWLSAKHLFLFFFFPLLSQYWRAGFLLRILWGSQSGNYPENNLAILGYIIAMKVGKKNIESFYFLGFLLEVIIRPWGFGIFFLIWAIFPMKKSFVWGQNHIFQVKIRPKNHL
jgi:hypothetical protein